MHHAFILLILYNKHSNFTLNFKTRQGGVAMSTIIELKNVYKSFYTNSQELLVLEDLNLTLKKGEILGILGPSGCGKSTILNLLSSLIKPTSGMININGNIGYMFQRDHLLEWRNIIDNITIGLEIQKKINTESMLKIDSLLKKYDLWDFRHHYPHQLSGGMRQRVALIRTLATNPDVLLLDEPFSSLDYQTRLQVSDDVYRIIRQEHKEAILVTHDISEAISMVDKAVILSKRPAKVKSIHNILLTVEGEKTPITARKAPEFKDYFNILWKELDYNEKQQ